MKNKIFKISLILLFSVFSIVKSEDEYNDWYENYNYQPYHEKYAEKENEKFNEFNNLNSKPIFDLIQNSGEELKKNEYINNPENYSFWKDKYYQGFPNNDNESNFKFYKDNLMNKYYRNKIYPKHGLTENEYDIGSARRFSIDMNNLNIMNLFDRAQELENLKGKLKLRDKDGFINPNAFNYNEENFDFKVKDKKYFKNSKDYEEASKIGEMTYDYTPWMNEEQKERLINNPEWLYKFNTDTTKK